MADLLDQILQGVPSGSGRGSAPSIFGPNAVSSQQANRISADRVNTQSQLLETRSRFNKLNREEQTRIEGQRALNELSQLDPRSDVDYMDKVQDILARNPNASLDGAVSNFLGVQSGIYEDSEADRDAEAQLVQRQQEDQRNWRKQRKRNQVLNEDNKDFRDSVEDEDTIDSFTPAQRERYRELAKKTNPKRALRRVKDEVQNAAEFNAVLESGVPESVILDGLVDADGTVVQEPLVDDKGRIDRKRLDAYKGKQRALQAKREALEDDLEKKRAQLRSWMEYQKTLQDPLLEASDEEKLRTARNISQLQNELNPELDGGAPSPETGTTTKHRRGSGKKDTGPADKYFQ